MRTDSGEKFELICLWSRRWVTRGHGTEDVVPAGLGAPTGLKLASQGFRAQDAGMNCRSSTVALVIGSVGAGVKFPSSTGGCQMRPSYPNDQPH